MEGLAALRYRVPFPEINDVVPISTSVVVQLLTNTCGVQLLHSESLMIKVTSGQRIVNKIGWLFFKIEITLQLFKIGSMYYCIFRDWYSVLNLFSTSLKLKFN
jgi:hypothetical protein